MAKKIQAQKMSREAESQFIANNLPGFMGARQYAFDWMNPANNQAVLQQFINQQNAMAAQMGQQSANQAAWQGLGSGAQQAGINSAMRQGLGAAGNFARMQLSPDFIAAQFNQLRGLMDPFQNRTEKELSALGKSNQATKKSYTSQGGLGGILGGIGQLAGLYGQFGNMGGGGATGGGAGAPSSSYSLGTKSYMNYTPSNYGGLGTGSQWQLPVTF
jgi:hypothetical protein